jgi:LuxR family maltose regulon positive regulatory protein
VLETQGSAALLGELEASNLFLVPLDDRRQWYRYHQLFADLLRLQLRAREPGLVPVLHRRAAAWHQAAGQIDQAIGHASAAGDLAEAGTLVARHWASHWLGGQRATVAHWLDGLPEAAILADPPVALIAAWSRGFGGGSKQDTERWLAAAADKGYGGPPPVGMRSQAFGAALARATLIFDDVGRALKAARRAVELAAASLARRAVATAEAHGVSFEPLSGIVYLALGRSLAGQGELAEAEVQLERALELFESTAWACTAPTGCWCSRRCVTVEATGQALGRWPTRPTT